MADEIENRLSGLLGEESDESRLEDWFELEDAGEDVVNMESVLSMDDDTAEDLDLRPLTLPKEDDEEINEEKEAALAALLSYRLKPKKKKNPKASPEADSQEESGINHQPQAEGSSHHGEEAEEELEDLFPELSGRRPEASEEHIGEKKDASSKEETAANVEEETDAAFGEKQEKGKILKVRGMGDTEDYRDTFPWRGWLIVIGLILIAFGILNSPVFSLKSYEVEGNERISDEDILRDLDLYQGINLFRYAVQHINKEPQVDSRLSTVDVYFKWPSHVRIVVEESQTIGYIYFQGSYLCIDRKGQVAASTRTPDDDLPLIKGIQVKSFSIGESLSTSDAERYDAVVTIGSTLRKYELSGIVTEINVHNLADIILTSSKLEARCGDMTDIGQKIAVYAELLSRRNVPSGILHIESMGNEIYIEPFE